MDRVVRHAIGLGADPMVAIQMATLNTAEHFGVAREVGQIAPGRYADFLIVSDLPAMQIDSVFAKGVEAAISGKLQIELPEFEYPPEVKTSINLGRALRAEDFQLKVQGAGEVEVNVIGVVENQAPTQHLTFTVPILEGEIQVDMVRDLAKVALVERHQGTGQVQVGLVSGFGFSKPCAIGSTVAHDSHHMLVVGTDEESMAIAANDLAAVGGGQVVVLEGEVVARVELPIAGLMSDERAGIVAEKAEKVLQAFEAVGCTLNNANMQLSLLALVVIPALRISDKGLVDVTRFEVIPLVRE